MNVLLTTDFSFTSEHAMEFAMELFDPKETHYTLLHVVHIPHAGMVLTKTLAKEVSDHAHRKLNDLKQHLKNRHPEISLEITAEIGVFKSTVARWVENHDIHFLVMGTNGTSGIFEKLIGSHTREVVDYISVPTLVIPMTAPIQKESRILMAVSDLDFKDRDTIHTYFGGLRTENTSICIYTISDQNVEFRSDSDYVEILPESLRSHVTRVVEKRSENLLQEDQLLTFAEENNHNLIAIFPQSRNWFQKLLRRSVTLGALKNSTIPLLIIR